MDEQRSSPPGGLTPRCPECGRADNDRSIPRPPSLFHWRRSVPVIVVLIAMIGFIAWLVGTARSGRTGTGGTYVEAVVPAFTRTEIEKIASESETANPVLPDTGGRLVTAVADELEHLELGWFLRSAPGERKIHVAFISPRGTCTTTTRWGWPSQWLVHAERRWYENAILQEGFKPTVTNPNAKPLGRFEVPREPDRFPARPRLEWTSWGIHWQPPPEQTTGAIVTTTFHPFALIPLVAFLVVGYVVIGTSLLIFTRLIPTVRPVKRRRAKFIVIAALVLFALPALLHHRTTDATIHEQPRLLFDRSKPRAPPIRDVMALNLDLEGIKQLPHTVEGDQALARVILDAEINNGPPPEYQPTPVSSRSADSTDPRDRLLAVSLSPLAVVRNGTSYFINWIFPVVIASEYPWIIENDDGTTTPLASPRGWDVNIDSEGLHVVHSTGVASEPTRMVFISLHRLGGIIVAAWLLWLIARLCCALAYRRIVGRRRAAERCVACGYLLRAAPAAA